jgi:hypothetical protein
MTERKNDSEHNSDRDQSPPSQTPHSFDSHGDLEHTSPTDSRADEKVIVNHRPGMNNSFSNSENKNEQ